MVVNEKGLLSAMKNAYKKQRLQSGGGGKWGPGEDHPHGARLGSDLYPEASAKKSHGPDCGALGRRAEIRRGLPGQKKETKAVIFGMALDSVPKVDQEPQWKIMKTDLTMAGMNLWQRSADNQIIRIEPDLEDIISGYGRDIVMAGDGTVVVAGAVSRVYIQCLRIKSKEEAEKLNYLGKIAWVGV